MPGDCHYLEGNVNARRRVEHARKLLEEIGLEPQRLQMVNLSSAMAGEFTFYAAEIHAAIQGLGPSPLRSNGAPGTGQMEQAATRKEGAIDEGDVNDT